MIIGLCGRMRAGKSTLAEVCEEHGFKRLAFADHLKGLCADLLDIGLEELNKIKNDGTKIYFDLGQNDAIDILSVELDIPIKEVRLVCSGRVMDDARQMLQFVGTELIRKYNPCWHIERTRSMIVKGVDYVIDDVRFPNEKEMIESLGGDCWFVVRPSLSNISRHASENALRWQDCWGKVIVNEMGLDELKDKWSHLISDYEINVSLRDDVLKSIEANGREADIDTIDAANGLLIPTQIITYKEPILGAGIDVADFVSNGGVSHVLTLKLYDGTTISTSNPLEIEDLKFSIAESDLTLFN